MSESCGNAARYHCLAQRTRCCFRGIPSNESCLWSQGIFASERPRVRPNASTRKLCRL